MNRKDRRAKAKLDKKNAASAAVQYVCDAETWGAYKSPEPEPKEIEVPGVNVPPVSEAFNKMVDSNEWHDRNEFDTVAVVIKSLSDENSQSNTWSWAKNHACKYVNIRIDMRDGGFIVTNQEGNRINLEQLLWQYKSVEKGEQK